MSKYRSVCTRFQCVNFSEVTNEPSGSSGSVGGYGCSKFAVATHCPAYQVKGVTASQYELFFEDGDLCLSQEMLINLAIKV